MRVKKLLHRLARSLNHCVISPAPIFTVTFVSLLTIQSSLPLWFFSSFFFLKIFLNVMCMGVFLHIVHYMHACCLWRPEDGTGSPGTGVQTVVSHRVGVLGVEPESWKSSQCSQPLSHPSSPRELYVAKDDSELILLM